MIEILYLKELNTYGVVGRYWKDNSMVYVTPIDSKYGRWFLPWEVREVEREEYLKALWSMNPND